MRPQHNSVFGNLTIKSLIKSRGVFRNFPQKGVMLRSHILRTHEKNKYSEAIKTIKVKADLFERVNHIPHDVAHISKHYFLSKITCANYRDTKLRLSHTLFEEGYSLGYKLGFYNDNIWSKKSADLINLNMPVKNNDFLMLELYGWNPLRKDMQKLNLHVSVNGDGLRFVRVENNKYYFALPNLHEI